MEWVSHTIIPPIHQTCLTVWVYIIETVLNRHSRAYSVKHIALKCKELQPYTIPSIYRYVRLGLDSFLDDQNKLDQNYRWPHILNRVRQHSEKLIIVCSISPYAQELLSDVLNHLSGSHVRRLRFKASVDELNFLLLDELLNDPGFNDEGLRDSLQLVVLPWYHGEVTRPLVDCCVEYGFKKHGKDFQPIKISNSGCPAAKESATAQGTPLSLIQRTLKSFGVSHDLELVDIKATAGDHVMVDVLDIECLNFSTRPTLSIETLNLGDVDIDDNIDLSLLDFKSVKHIAVLECANIETLWGYFISIASDLQIKSVGLDNFGNYVDLRHDDEDGTKAFLTCFSGLERLYIAAGEK